MSELDRIVDQFQRAFDGDAWHGPPLMKLLSETSADEAYDRPLKSRHTIWELTLHIAAWKGEVTKALRGETFHILEPEQNWPPVESADEEA